jgi:hypothetical protein
VTRDDSDATDTPGRSCRHGQDGHRVAAKLGGERASPTPSAVAAAAEARAGVATTTPADRDLPVPDGWSTPHYVGYRPQAHMT